MIIKNTGFWIRVCLIGSAFLLITKIAQAQSNESNDKSAITPSATLAQTQLPAAW